jgi:hypothetical protein
MAGNYIVLRQSPDWLSFDPENSRPFCLQMGFPETTVIDFITIWDASLPIGYREFRHALKAIALKNFAAVKGSSLVDFLTLEERLLPEDALVTFVDDDDWFAPNLFERLLEKPSGDGFKWGSVALGFFSHTLHEQGLGGLLTMRKLDNVIYTNNYVVSGQCLARLGSDVMLQHGNAQEALSAHRFLPVTINEYLSCANKHPASTVAARFFLTSEDFRRDPRAEIERFAQRLAAVTLTEAEGIGWIGPALEDFKNLLAEAIR